MPRPERADRCNDLPPFLGCSGDKPMQHPSAEITPVQDYVDDEHKTDYGVPCRDHTERSFLGSRSFMLLSTAESHCFRPDRGRSHDPPKGETADRAQNTTRQSQST